MSGALAAMVGVGQQIPISVTVGAMLDGAGNTYGFANGAGGSGGAVSPSSIKGVSIVKLTSFTPTAFHLLLSGTLARTFIQGITVQKTDGTIAWLAQGDATFSANGTFPGNTLWSWTPSVWTNTGTRFVLVRY